MKLDKAALLAALRAQIAADLDALVASQKQAHEGATHEEARPESDKDTRATEASYVARGLAERVRSLELAVHRLASFELRDFGPDAAIATGALIHVEDQDGEHHYFVAPAGGGLTITHDGVTVGIITPRSPLGQALLGARTDDDLDLDTPRGLRQLTVLAVR
jgi:transcription elongation GreA/GreB family factor